MTPQRTAVARRRGMTFMELMIASSITAMVGMAGATMMFAVSSATVEIRDNRNERNAGHNAMYRIANKIRTARGIGEVTPEAIVLWERDENEDDQLNMKEMSVIRYDSGSKQVIYERVSGAAASADQQIAANVFTDLSSAMTAISGSEKQQVVLAEDVENLNFTAYPENTDTRVIHTYFTIKAGDEDLPFHKAASPKAPADYLFVTEAKLPAQEGTTRPRRKYYSRWTGFADIRGDSPSLIDGLLPKF